MNRDCFRLVLSRALNAWVAVAEHCKCRRKSRGCGRTRRLGSQGLLAFWISGSVIAQTLAPGALPEGAQLTQGQAVLQRQGNQLNIIQSSDRVGLDWQRFDIGSHASVRFEQPSRSALAINRVLGTAPSQIDGALLANGQVYLINPQGMMFGAGAQVDVGGLVATTLTFDDVASTPANSRFHALNAASAGSVINQGHLRAAPGGYLVLAGAQVRNGGSLSTPLGSTVLAAGGETLALALDGYQLLNAQLSGTQAYALIDNAGLIVADGGQVLLTARGRQQAFSQVVNHSGVIQARRIGQTAGRITLDGGGSGIVELSGRVDAQGLNGLNDRLASGGQIQVLGDQLVLRRSALLDASGPAGGGEILVGGNQGGVGPQPNARTLRMDAGATLLADATVRGDGGKLVVWGTDNARIQGRLSAIGGPQGGNGGFIETSSHVLNLDGVEVNAASRQGRPGVWLIDPYNVTITNGVTDNAGNYASGTWTPTGSGSSISNATIKAALESGNNVLITTNGAGVEAGDITVNGAINYAPLGTPVLTPTLTLAAHGQIIVNQPITSAAQPLNLVMASNIAGSTNGGIGVYAPLATQGGDLTLGGGALSGGLPTGAAFSANGTGVNLGASVDVGTGTLRISGASTNGVGVLLNNATINTRQAAITGVSDALLGLQINGTTSLNQAGSGILTLSGASNTSLGLALGTSLTLTTNGTVNMQGSSTQASGTLLWNASDITRQSGSLTLQGTGLVAGTFVLGTHALHSIGAGTLSITGNSGAGAGIQVYNGSSFSTDGRVDLAGTSASSVGFFWDTNTGLTALGPGTLTLSGSSNSSVGALWLGGNTVANAGTLSMVGTSSSGIGMQFNGTQSLINTGASFQLTGVSGSTYGIGMVTSSTLGTQGNLTLAGTSVSSGGFYLSGTSTITAVSGDLTLSGNSANDFAFHVDGSNNQFINQGAGTLTVRGDNTLGVGLEVNGGALFQNSAAGQLRLVGNSDSDLGLGFIGTNSLVNSGSGSFTVAGTASTAGYGAALGNGASLNIAGPVSLSANGYAGGWFLAGANLIDHNGVGTLSLTGAASHGNDIYLQGNNTLNTTGAGSWLVSGDMLLAGNLSLGGGTGSLTVNGDIEADSAAANRQLSIQSTGAVALNGSVGATQALGQVDTDSGGSTTLRDVFTTGAQTYQDALRLNGQYHVGGAGGFVASSPISLGGDTTIISTNGAISLAVLNADASANARRLRIDGAGAVNLNGAGQTQRLGEMLISGATVGLSGDLAATGLLSITARAADLTVPGLRLTSAQGDLVLAAGAAQGRGMATGGDVVIQSGSVLSIGANSQLRLYTGRLASLAGLQGTIQGIAAAQVFAPGSGNFRYGRQSTDAVDASDIGTAPPGMAGAYLLFREQPSLSVMAASGSNKYYDRDPSSDPVLPYTLTGARNGDTAQQILSGALSRNAGQAAGQYAINVGNLTDRLGYRLVIDTNSAVFTILPRPLQVVANDQLGVYARDFTLSARYEGWAPGENEAQFTRFPSLATPARVGSLPGQYPIFASGGLAPNYDLRYVAGTLYLLPATFESLLWPAQPDAIPSFTRVMPALPGQPSRTGAIGSINLMRDCQRDNQQQSMRPESHQSLDKNCSVVRR